MVDVSSQSKNINVTASSIGTAGNINVTPDMARYWSEKSKQWAVSDRLIDDEDYSSKYYANQSKQNAKKVEDTVQEVIDTANSALSDIGSAKDNAIYDITSQENISVENVNTAGTTQISNITNAGTTQVNNVNTAGAEQVTLATQQATIATQQATIATNKADEVVSSGNTAISNINEAKNNAVSTITTLKNEVQSIANTSLSDIDTAKTSAITSITNQETISKNSLIDEGATQVGLIQQEGQTQISNIEQTGFYMRDGHLYYIDENGQEQEFVSGGGSSNLGVEYDEETETLVFTDDGTGEGGNGGGGTADSVEWGNIQGTLSNQTDLSDQLQNIREVAEGKTNTYVVSYENNPIFNSQDDSIQLTGSFVDINNVEHDITELKLGDNIYVQELDVPDRWCSQLIPVVPEEYTQLQYLESTGTQHIVIPYKMNNKTSIFCRYAQVSNNPNNVSAIFGVTTAATPTSANFGCARLLNETTNVNRVSWGNNITGSAVNIIGYNLYENWYNIYFELNNVYINNQLVATTATNPSTIWTAKYNMALFARGGLEVDAHSNARISSFKIEEEGKLLYNLIPAKRNSDNVLGMYDTVSETFFTNAGTGEFIGKELLLGVTLYKLETSKVVIPSYNTETWTFTLDDGTEVTKNMVVGS